MTFFKKYLLPGFIFQSIVIGGGYGTGRELVEFFLAHGPLGGYFGMILAMLIWSAVMAITFELARMGKTYDYRSFLNNLLGKWWIVYEICYVLGLILVISVIGSASGELIHEISGLPEITGIIVMMVLVGFFVFYGSALIVKALSVWSFMVYAVYIGLVLACWMVFGDTIKDMMSIYRGDSQWIWGGVKYAGYNIVGIPALLFSIRYIELRREAFISGAFAGAIGMIPGFLIYTAMLSQYPEIVSEVIPSNFILSKLGSPIFQAIFQVILLGTFIETGIGVIHGFNERIAGVYQERGIEMPRSFRLGIALSVFIVATYIANAVGLIGLIAKGYGTITWVSWIIYVFPVLTLGIWRIKQAENEQL
jgi:uncharacterized membrane protein YkvI